MPPVFNLEKCTACGNCVEDCPGYILELKEEGVEVAYPDECWHCGNCRMSCPAECVSYEFPVTMLV